MDSDELTEIESRAAAATNGTWEADDGRVLGPDDETLFVVEGAGPQLDADVRFVAAARDDVPALCAEVRKLRTAVRVGRKLLKMLSADRRALARIVRAVGAGWRSTPSPCPCCGAPTWSRGREPAAHAPGCGVRAAIEWCAANPEGSESK
jgi:hypothetical protein